MPATQRLKLGEILVEQRILTPHLVKRIIRISRATRRRFGQTLEDLGLLTGDEIAQALAIQYGYKIVSDITKYVIPEEVLRRLPVDQAFEHQVFPLQVKDGNLALAMSDPTNPDLIANLSSSLGLRIVPFISTTREIMRAIAKYYLGEPHEPRPNAILVVETDSRERDILVSPLTREGYQVLEAVDATDGFQMALLHQPLLVITAKEMPGGDGYAFFTALQSVPETRRIPVILLAGRPSVEEEAMAFQRGFFDYIPMPARDITLLTRVARAIAAGRSYAPHRREATDEEDGA